MWKVGSRISLPALMTLALLGGCAPRVDKGPPAPAPEPVIAEPAAPPLAGAPSPYATAQADISPDEDRLRSLGLRVERRPDPDHPGRTILIISNAPVANPAHSVRRPSHAAPPLLGGRAEVSTTAAVSPAPRTPAANAPVRAAPGVDAPVAYSPGASGPADQAVAASSGQAAAPMTTPTRPAGEGFSISPALLVGLVALFLLLVVIYLMLRRGGSRRASPASAGARA